MREYSVQIDGRYAGRIKRRSYVIFDVEPGAHWVRVRLDWWSSPLVRVDVPDGDIAKLVCGPNSLFESVLHSFWKTDRFLRLEPI